MTVAGRKARQVLPFNNIDDIDPSLPKSIKKMKFE
jgi:hypothetical protein